MFVGYHVNDRSNTISVSLMVAGRQLEVYRRQFDGKYFVGATPGQAYTLIVENLTFDEIEVVCAIDQRDTQSDRPASTHNRGMKVQSRGSTCFGGWRIDDGKVGSFVFAEPEHSVAGQAEGDMSGVGIIGFAVFKQVTYRPQPVITTHYPRRPVTFGNLGSMGPTAKGGVGTGIGATIASPVTRVRFERATSDPMTILEIGYDTPKWLHEQGIIAPAEPTAFPITDAFAEYRRV